MPYYVFYYLPAADQLASNLTANICSIWVVQHSILAFDFFFYNNNVYCTH